MEEVRLDSLNQQMYFVIFMKALMKKEETSSYIKGLLKNVKLDSVYLPLEVLNVISLEL